ncbi:MAG: DUF3380 domain-containing protein [Alphaproteobacteria bacterium]|nr:DUF3380 domain-containing protein [Alphaproteobacteria bacterium]
MAFNQRPSPYTGGNRHTEVSNIFCCRFCHYLGNEGEHLVSVFLRYPRLIDAIKINETAALKSASWGIGQILGQNYQLTGYTSVQAMVRAFTEDEELQLKAAVDFIKSESLDDDLRDHRWQGFARGYNGPGYAKNRYDKKLAAAFAKWSKIRDTPYDPVPVAPIIPDLYPAVDIPDPVKPPAPNPILNIIGGILEWIGSILSPKV